MLLLHEVQWLCLLPLIGGAKSRADKNHKYNPGVIWRALRVLLLIGRLAMIVSLKSRNLINQADRIASIGQSGNR